MTLSSLILPLSAERSLKQHRNLEKRRQIDEFVKVAKSFMSSAGFGQGSPVAGNARGYGAGGVTPGTPMRTSWTNNAGNAAILQRATQAYGQQHNLPVGELEQALADQGLSWGPPFAPGRPLDPFTGYRQPARTRNYPVGENVQITPRRGRVSFEILRAIHEAWDVSGICVQHLVNDVRSLDSSWLPADGVKTDVSADVEKAQAFFLKPDRRRPFRNWLAMWLQDVFRWDAGALYVRRNNLGEPIALEVVDGSTVIPLADYYGRLPLDETDNDEPFDTLDLDAVDIVPAYVQIIQGMPWTWLTAEDLIYLPLNPVPESQYGLAPIEKVMMSGNLDVRFQMHFLQYFTSGSLPAGLMEAPADMSDPAQIQQWQEIWDAIMLGDQEKLRQIRWVPAGAKFTATKNSDFDEKFPLYLMRRGCAAYGVTPADLGFTEQVNKSSGDTQIDVQFRVGTRPPSRHVEDVLTLFAQHELGLRVKFQIDDGREVEDRVATAQAHSIYIQAGVESPDEVRDEIGRPTDKTQAVSRFIQTRQGVVMLEELLGKTQNPIDPETFAPAGKVAYVPPVPAPIAPAAAGASEQAAASDATPAGEKPAVPGGQDAANTNTSPVTKAETAGITAATRIAGVDLLGHSTDDDDEDDDDDSEIRKALVDVALRRWRSNARNRLRKGQAPRRFVDSNLPDGLRDAVWRRLEHATTREQVDQAFSNPKALARKAGASTPGDFWRHAVRIVEHYSRLVAEALHGLWSDETLEAAATAAAEPEGKAAALTVLEGGKGSTDALRRLLAELYGDAGLQGAHEAAHAAGGQVVASLQGVTTQLPDSYWDAWQPGWGDAAAKVAGGGLKQLLDAADITIKGMTDSAIERVGNALAEALAAGDSYQDAAKAVREIVASKARSELIANTETCRAMTQAALDTYHENGIEQVSWQAEATACPACEANAGGGPYALDDAPTVPQHPGCRCNLLPIVDE